VRLRLADGRELRYTDVRRLGTFAVLSSAALAAWSATIGPEPLDPDFTPERFSGCIRGTKRAIKAVLMDQSRLAGVGNIYANEALWRAGSPARRASTLTPQCAALHHELTGAARGGGGTRHVVSRLSRCLWRARRLRFAAAGIRARRPALRALRRRVAVVARH
jgi:formamidopyrimidine-DNA glycosylase